MYTDKQHREIFHLLFLERLLKSTDPKLYAVKGGCNLRFFFYSPRYSEDLDLDVFGGSVETLKKNGYKILADPAFVRNLNSFGIDKLIVNDPSKAKHSTTTQRFRCQLVNQAGESFPTKVEFSRRSHAADGVVSESINPELLHTYKRRSFASPHYDAIHAASQKIDALANRTEVQARDPFDLYLLVQSGAVKSIHIKELDRDTRTKATENLLQINFEYFHDQVVQYLELEVREEYNDKNQWQTIQNKLLELLHV